jgi:hypothetical protein
MNIYKSKKFIALVVGIAAAAALAVGAYAYFTSTGTGSGSASVGTSTTWQVTTLSATGGPLTPGGPTESITYKVKNNSSGSQSLANVAISVANADGSAWTAVSGCSKSDFAIDGASAGLTFNDTSQAANLAPGATATGTITLQMVDSGSNQDGCKGATVPLYLSAS